MNIVYDTNYATTIDEQTLYADLIKLLDDIGPGTQITESVYDIAWLAHLGEIDKTMAEMALDWLRANQLEDGSWGTPTPIYYHDRLISTLAATIALAKWGKPGDKERIQRGAFIVEYLQKNLGTDPAGETIAFEMLIPTLLKEAQQLGLVHDSKTQFLNGLSHVRDMKLSKAPRYMISRYTTMAHSAEMVGPEGLYLLDVDNLQEKNGSIGYSPAATAFYALNVSYNDLDAMEFLRRTAVAGRVPYVSPIDTFEYGWTLWNLALVDSLRYIESLATTFNPGLDFLEANWEPGQGIAACARLSFIDTDAASIVHEVLTRYGRSVDLEAILRRERETHFICYQLEANPSLSTNIHVMGALKAVGYEADHPTVAKIRRFLHHQQTAKSYWLDKWQASPYYTTSHAVITAAGYDNRLVEDAVQWILSTQNWDGSWGYYDEPTAEETAYCLQALAIWHKQGFDLPAEVFQHGARWLAAHKEPPYPPLWIGKTLYTPTLVVRSAILSALLLMQEILG